MKHEFTDDQIIDAKHAAARHMSRDWISRFNVKDIRAFLDALPEPQDEWEQCTIDQIRKGDRFKVEGRGWHYESTAIHIGVDIVCVNPRTGSFITRDEVDQINEITLYRIPAPVVHPDPDNNPVILVREVHGKTYDPPVVAIVRDSSTQNHPVYVYGDNGSAFPDYITDWSPARVVADDE